MDAQTLKLERRDLTGKKVRRLRRQGIIPVHVYGADIQPASLQVDERSLNRLLPRVGSTSPSRSSTKGRIPKTSASCAKCSDTP